MMTKIDDGGSAFPMATTENTIDFHGMSLRDYFAAQALVGLGTWMPGNYGILAAPDAQAARARFAYQQADAMLAARTASPTGEAE